MQFGNAPFHRWGCYHVIERKGVSVRVCLYTRISTDEENQPTSLHSQRERLDVLPTDVVNAADRWSVSE